MLPQSTVVSLSIILQKMSILTLKDMVKDNKKARCKKLQENTALAM